MALKTNYKEDILASGNTRRKYNMITNDDGTVSFEDVTDYEQTGDSFGAGDVNSANIAINQLVDNYHILKIAYCERYDITSYESVKEQIDVPDGTISVIPFFIYLDVNSNSEFSISGIYHTLENGQHYIMVNGKNISYQVGYICVDKARN